MLAVAFARGQIDWKGIGRYFTAPTILWSLVNTVVMAVLVLASASRSVLSWR